LLLGALVAALLPGYAMAADIPARVMGEYVGTACRGGDESCVPTGTGDRVRITRQDNGKARVELHISFDRGQSCSLDGAAAWTGQRLELVLPGLDANRPCDLVLNIHGSELSLSDKGFVCRMLYCGSRGTLEGTHFIRRH
jgi:hypothetical protein